MKPNTAKQLATYTATNLGRWCVHLSDGSSHTVWANSKHHAIALAVQKRLAETGQQTKALAYATM